MPPTLNIEGIFCDTTADLTFHCNRFHRRWSKRLPKQVQTSTFERRGPESFETEWILYRGSKLSFRLAGLASCSTEIPFGGPKLIKMDAVRVTFRALRVTFGALGVTYAQSGGTRSNKVPN